MGWLLPVDQTLQARLTMLQSVAAQVSCDWAEAGRLARQALAALGGSWWRDPLGRFGWNGIARDAALSERWDETSDEVRETDFAFEDATRNVGSPSRGPVPWGWCSPAGPWTHFGWLLASAMPRTSAI